MTNVSPRKHALDGGQGAILGVVRPTEKHWSSLVQCTQQRHHSIVNSSMQQKGSFSP